ncbi:protein of unknown function [Caminicella sporogenes DSM 14501]|uniref:Transcobalamin-like C-terminal domain-containing protein n=1 Tax=Caminicella sporogenes DSM 14501 TaxID=1121266 RepID=A0A1M6PEQ8_9FIRM|nr:DUF4430 domain-containing protein [Caminicella sporogenes]RKD21426.1 hypothetical protein BET04_08285 [Caminicella sporogenes]SHK06407.1 protein of unknown function [Caminicella sporogenes DSM 14501]
MKENIFKKYIGMILILLLFTIFMAGCNNAQKTKEITNIGNKQEEQIENNSQIKEQKSENIENEKSSSDNVVIIDGVAYKGYKGPVQGEIKYKEGTPADENSHSYKASGDIESPYHVDLIVTRDYGHKTIFCKNVGLVKDEVGMEVLFRNLDIQTAYGGGFVNAINGIESKFTFYTGKDRKKMDWFYWVNGILAPVGVAEYRPQPNDEIWWDYHDWSITMFIPAVIGSYPHPFINGFFGKNPGTVIMYTEDFKEEAEKLKQSLSDLGVKQVDTALFDPEVIKKPKKYYILVGVWNELAKNSKVIRDINKKNKLIGVYAKFQDGKLYGLNFKGKVISTHSEAGAIFAYASSIGSTRPIWMVTGTNNKGVNMALDILINNPNAIDRHFGAIISKDGVENIPYVD